MNRVLSYMVSIDVKESVLQANEIYNYIRILSTFKDILTPFYFLNR